VGRLISLSDTVGFIRDLPHSLVDAFQATLQEAVDADLLLHVVDFSSPDYPEQMAQVQRVLAEIGAQNIAQVLVFNKLDAVAAERQPHALQDVYLLDGQPLPRVFISAASGLGLAQLRAVLAEQVARKVVSDAEPLDPRLIPHGEGVEP
jgi:GTP-binding protein HflX